MHKGKTLSSIRSRIAFDALLSVALIFEMLYQVTGNTLHEIVGAVFLVCIIVHVAMSARWIKRAARAVAEGTLGKKQKRLVAVTVLLAIDMLVMIVSSIVISQSIWDAGVDLAAFNPGNIWYPLHTISAYALSVLVLGHLVMHWSTVADALRIEYDPSRREAISSALSGVVMIGGIALGVVGVMRAGFQMSDYSVSADEEDSEMTLATGYRERNAETGEITTGHSFEVEKVTDDDSTGASESDAGKPSDEICPLCPRRCKLSAPRCQRPYEAGLI